MFEILRNMIKEEWRIHSSVFGNVLFALFPFLLIVFAFLGSFLLPIFLDVLSIKQILILAHYLFVLFGLSVGGFGLLGREVMNRRFGQASLIAYSSKTLPITERKIFLNFFVKDLIYYFFLWILPIVSGFVFASLFLSINLFYSFLLLLTLTLSFLIGLSLIFFLSTIYAHSSKVLIIVLVLFTSIGILITSYFSIDSLILPSVLFFFTLSFKELFLSLFSIITFSSLSLIFLKVDYPEKKRRFKNQLDKLSERLKFIKYPYFVSKDFLDLKRSEGGLGKIIFSFLFPVLFIWLVIYVFLKFVPVADFLLMFSILLGVMSSTIYNWLTEFDLFTSYSFLPVKVSNVIKSKINSYMLINLISLIILIVTTIWINKFVYFLPSFFAFLGISSYALSVTIYLTGLYPNILLYNSKIFLEYLILLLPVLLILIYLSVAYPFYLVFTLILIPVSIYLLKISYKKWDNFEQPNF